MATRPSCSTTPPHVARTARLPGKVKTASTSSRSAHLACPSRTPCAVKSHVAAYSLNPPAAQHPNRLPGTRCIPARVHGVTGRTHGIQPFTGQSDSSQHVPTASRLPDSLNATFTLAHTHWLTPARLTCTGSLSSHRSKHSPPVDRACHVLLTHRTRSVPPSTSTLASLLGPADRSTGTRRHSYLPSVQNNHTPPQSSPAHEPTFQPPSIPACIQQRIPMSLCAYSLLLALAMGAPLTGRMYSLVQQTCFLAMCVFNVRQIRPRLFRSPADSAHFLYTVFHITAHDVPG